MIAVMITITTNITISTLMKNNNAVLVLVIIVIMIIPIKYNEAVSTLAITKLQSLSLITSRAIASTKYCCKTEA